MIIQNVGKNKSCSGQGRTNMKYFVTWHASFMSFTIFKSELVDLRSKCSNLEQLYVL